MLFLQFVCGVIVTLEKAQDEYVTQGVGGGVKMVSNGKVLLIIAYRAQMLRELVTESVLDLTDVEESNRSNICSRPGWKLVSVFLLPSCSVGSIATC
eukprot:g36302.t1